MADQLPLMFVVPGSRPFDLPPTWDGHRVEWDAWRIEPVTSVEYHRRYECCEHCGSQTRRSVCSGKVHPAEGAQFDSVREKRLPSGRTYEKAVKVPAWPVFDLFVFRCPDCRVDSVLESSTDKWWTLDDSDYTAAGSVAP